MGETKINRHGKGTTIEEMEDENLMFSASYTCTTSYTEDPSVDDDDYIHIHPNPIEPTEPIDGDDDY